VPFPVKADFTSEGGTLLIQFAGSAWSSKGQSLSVDLQVDGATVATAKVTTNEVNSHKALVPAAVLTSKIAAGTHTCTVVAASGTNVDQNDFFTITVTEYGLT